MSGPLNQPLRVDVSHYASPLSGWNKLARAIWGLVWLLFFRPSPRIGFGWRRGLLRLFGARIAHGVHVYPSAKIWAPWNLEMGEYSCISHQVDCYCVDKITIGAQAMVSQYSYLCTASHDTTDPQMRLITAPIRIDENAWICADVYVGPGVTIGSGAVVGARASVFKSVDPWIIVGGNPAKFIKPRILKPVAGG